MKIIAVKYLSDYKLEVKFANGKIVIADFENFITSAQNPMITQFANKTKFRKVKIEAGFLTWGDGEMEISALSVYEKYNTKSKIES